MTDDVIRELHPFHKGTGLYFQYYNKLVIIVSRVVSTASLNVEKKYEKILFRQNKVPTVLSLAKHKIKFGYA
jgi:hypothetical protein